MGRRSSLAKLCGGIVSSLVFFGGPLLLGAWTLRWWRAWVFLGVVLVAAAVTMFGIFRDRPELLDERYGAPVQKGQPLADVLATFLIAGSFLGLLFFIGLDAVHLRLLGGIAPAPAAVGLGLFVAGWSLIGLVLAENAFAAPIVKRQEERGQRVVETGPYRFVRHPMYAGAVPLFVGMPLWLGSVAGMLVAALPVAAIAFRIRVEERFLSRELPGYAEYTRKVRWRLVPYLW